MINRFKEYIEANNLCNNEDRILVAVSGGIDSVFMLHLFYKCNYDFAIAHCNFNLRGNESDTDQQFVSGLAEKYNCEFYTQKFNTNTYAEENNLSVQMAARELRYKWFESVRQDYEFDYIAVAHNQDDIVETFFINLTRGTGIKGLTGIKSKVNNIIRPVLFAQRVEIEEYCKANSISFRQDSGNLSTKYLRNNIRHEIIPLFKKLNPKFNQTIIDNIEHLADAESIYSKEIQNIKNKLVVHKDSSTLINIEELKKYPDLIKTYIFEILNGFGFSNKIIEDIISSFERISGKVFLSKSFRLIKDRKFLIVTPLIDEEIHNYYIEEGIRELEVPIHIKFETINNNQKYIINKNTRFAYFDLNKLSFPLIVRKWRKGDFFQPFGMKGLKKVSDYFIDKKFSLLDKENAWLLTSGEKIIWIIGHRSDDRFKVTNQTSMILKVELIND